MLIGKRLRLRTLDRPDLPRCVAWLNDPEVRAGLLVYRPLSQTEEEAWFEAALRREANERPFAIERMVPEGWQHIGNIGLMNIDWRCRLAEVGIFIGEKAYWNQGYGREAMRLMLQYAFNTLNLNRISLHVFSTNIRAIRSYERTGFVQEGRLREDMFLDGEYVDVLVMGMLRREWQAHSVHD